MRETKEFTTKGGKKLIIKTYLTGREFNEIQQALLKDVKLSALGGQTKLDGFNAATAEQEATKKTIELMVVSVNGSTEKVTDAVLDLPYSEYAEVVAELNLISGKKKE